MNAEQVSQQIRIALTEGRGDKQASIRHLALMCARDDRLLRALVQPFLGGILLHALDREIKNILEQQEDNAALAASPPPISAQPASASESPPQIAKPLVARPAALSQDMMEQVVNILGKEIPVGRPVVPIDGDPVRLIGIGPGDIPPPKAGARHQRALQAVALSFKYKNT